MIRLPLSSPRVARVRLPRRQAPSGQASRLDLVSRVTEALRAEILSGRLATNAAMPTQSEVAQAFHVSQTVVRETMRNLRALGLVEVSQGRRPRIKPVDPQPAMDVLGALMCRCGASLEDLIQARRALEAETAALAAQRANSHQIQQLAQTIEEMKRWPDNERHLVAANLAFHRGLAEAAGNTVLVVLLSTLAGLTRELLHRTFPVAGNEHAVCSHARILDAIRVRDVDASRRAMLEHMYLALNDLHAAKAGELARRDC